LIEVELARHDCVVGQRGAFKQALLVELGTCALEADAPCGAWIAVEGHRSAINYAILLSPAAMRFADVDLKLWVGGSPLAQLVTKLADTEANGGAGITFNASSPGRATVTVNSEDEISFAISDAAGRNVMSGKLNNYRGSGATAVNSLATWNCTLHDSTTNLHSLLGSTRQRHSGDL
jgi:hypothetical protein